MRTVLEWARVRALGADGLSQREIAQRLGVNRRTVARLLASEEPPRYRRAPTGSRLDPLEPVLRRLLEEWPPIMRPEPPIALPAARLPALAVCPPELSDYAELCA